MSEGSANISPRMVISAYVQGAFPMADSRHGDVKWYQPKKRAILPLDELKVSRSLAKRIRHGHYRVTNDKAFAEVIRCCADPRAKERDTWINDAIIDAYCELHDAGFTHSFEAWDDNNQLVGGLYGLAIGGAFFGESMFSKASDASKVCLVALVDHLNTRGYQLLDTQIYNDHMAQFGIIEVSHDDYMKLLDDALQVSVTWDD